MFERLVRLFASDARARFRIIGISAVVVVTWGLVGQGFTDTSFSKIQTGATVFGIIVFATQVLLYSAGATYQILAPVHHNRRLLKSLATMAATTTLVLVLEISLPEVQAAVLTKRIRSALELEPPDSRITKLTRVFEDAERAQVRLSSAVLDKATVGLKQDQAAAAWKAIVASLEQLVDARADTPRRPSAATDWLDAQPMSIDNICGPENYTYGPQAQLSARHGEWIGDSTLKQWPNTIHHCRLVLDAANLDDVYVWAVLVSYRGGELHLHNVRFGQCRFDLPNGSSANVRKFVDAVLSADRNVVTIDLP